METEILNKEILKTTMNPINGIGARVTRRIPPGKIPKIPQNPPITKRGK
jgi:hypothetical protein